MKFPFCTASATFTLLAFTASSSAERPSENREDASHVITGKVEAVYRDSTEDYDNFVVEIAIDKLEKGAGLKSGDVLYASCFQRKKSAPPVPAAYGHSSVPNAGQTVRVFVNLRQGRYEGVYKDWVDVLAANERAEATRPPAKKGVFIKPRKAKELHRNPRSRPKSSMGSSNTYAHTALVFLTSVQ